MSPFEKPDVSVIVPVFRPNLALLREAVESVVRQTTSNWQLVVFDDGSGNHRVTEYLHGLGQNPRIITGGVRENLGISEATNRAIALAEADFVALLDQDDLLDACALVEVTEAIRTNHGVDIIYSDRLTISEGGIPVEIFRKPDWSPERLRSNMYVAHLTVLRKQRVLDVGGFDPRMDGSQDHDMVLKIAECGGGVVHLPEVLYHWRHSSNSTAADPRNKPHAALAGINAVSAHLSRVGLEAVVKPSLSPGVYGLERQPTPQAVTAVFTGQPNGRALSWLDQAVEEMGQVEVVVNEPCVSGRPGPGLLGGLARLASRIPEGVVIVLDPSTRANWPALRQLIAVAQEPDVGIAGARLARPSGRTAAAGLAVENRRLVVLGAGLRPSAPGPFARNQLDREVSGVVLSGCAMRAESLGLLGSLPVQLDPVIGGLVVGNAVWAQNRRVVQVNTVEVVTSASLSRRKTLPPEWAHPALNDLGHDRFSDPTPPNKLRSRAIRTLGNAREGLLDSVKIRRPRRSEG